MPRKAWVWEFIEPPAQRAGFVTFSYRVWESETAWQAGEAPFLANSHKAMIRESHQRRLRDGDGRLIHVSGAKVAPADVDAFLRDDPRSIHRDERGDWRADAGRKVTAPTFPTYDGRPEPLDPNWQRETFTVPVDDQVTEIIERYLDRAAVTGVRGDRRGTTINLQVGAGADDGYFYTAPEGEFVTLSYLAIYIFLGKVTALPTLAHTFARFAPVSGIGQATINEAVYQVREQVGHTSYVLETDLYAESASGPTAPTSQADAVSRQLTMAGVAWDGSLTPDDWNEKDVTAVIQELADNFDPSAIQILHYTATETVNGRQWWIESYDGDTALAPKLDLDITEFIIGPASISLTGRYDAIELVGRYDAIELVGRYDAIEKEGRYEE